jgi:MoxR-like ATPase
MEENLFEQRVDLSGLNKAAYAIRSEIGRVIIGQHKMVDLLLIGLLCDGHILIEGVPGVAKTLTAKLMAKIIDVDFSRLQFTPDLMPSDVVGTSVFNPREGDFRFKSGPIFSNIILIDEINRAPAKTQAALFEVMEERQVTVDGYTHLMRMPFIVLATQNPIGTTGSFSFQNRSEVPNVDRRNKYTNQPAGKIAGANAGRYKEGIITGGDTAFPQPGAINNYRTKVN